MSAEVNVTPDEGESIDAEYIKNMLRLEGVQAGIQNAAIENIVSKKLYGSFITVAVGKEAVDGADGKYDFHFVIPDKNNAPRIMEDGSVDYTPAITIVNKGDLVAEYHPRTNGVFGYNVFATVLTPKKGKELRPLQCQGVHAEDNKYYADKSGFISLKEHRLFIKDVLEINGDVDQTVGNLEFNGDIKIHGSILNNLMVTARGSIVVDGIIEGANVWAEKDILVAKGIHGGGMGRVSAGGNVCATYMDHSYVSAGGDIKIDYAISCVLEARGKVTAAGNYASIIGGMVSASGGVEAGTLGNNAEIPTQVTVGIADAAVEDLEEQQIVNLIAPIIVYNRIHRGVTCTLSGVLSPDAAGRRDVELRNLRGMIERREINGFTRDELDGAIPHRFTAGEEEEAKRKILVIDDDPKILRMVSDMLRDEYQVASANGGSVARKYLEKKKVDLILLDYMMPEENGVEVLKSLRANEATKDIPVVFLTGLEDKEKILECLSLKPAGYLAKPVNNRVLHEKLSAVLALG